MSWLRAFSVCMIWRGSKKHQCTAPWQAGTVEYKQQGVYVTEMDRCVCCKLFIQETDQVRHVTIVTGVAVKKHSSERDQYISKSFVHGG